MNNLVTSLLAFGDTHYPHDDKELISKIIHLTRREPFDHIVHLGDVGDNQQLGSYLFNPTKVSSLMGEISNIRDMFKRLRSSNPHSKIYLCCGNHDVRFITYLSRNAPYLLELDSMTIPELYHLDRYGVRFVPEEEHLVLPGDLCCVHGWFARQKAGYSIHGCLDNSSYKYIICGHTHKAALVSRFGRIGIEAGLTADPVKVAHYMRGKPHDAQQAFVVGHMFRNPETSQEWWELKLITVTNGSFVYNGVMY